MYTILVGDVPKPLVDCSRNRVVIYIESTYKENARRSHTYGEPRPTREYVKLHQGLPPRLERGNTLFGLLDTCDDVSVLCSLLSSLLSNDSSAIMARHFKPY